MLTRKMLRESILLIVDDILSEGKTEDGGFDTEDSREVGLYARTIIAEIEKSAHMEPFSYIVKPLQKMVGAFFSERITDADAAMFVYDILKKTKAMEVTPWTDASKYVGGRTSKQVENIRKEILLKLYQLYVVFFERSGLPDDKEELAAYYKKNKKRLQGINIDTFEKRKASNRPGLGTRGSNFDINEKPSSEDDPEQVANRTPSSPKRYDDDEEVTPVSKIKKKPEDPNKIREVKDKIPGGLADKRNPRDFNKAQLIKGIKVEIEHTSDKELALEIAMDHLAEIPDYYDRLENMEKKAKKKIVSPLREGQKEFDIRTEKGYKLITESKSDLQQEMNLNIKFVYYKNCKYIIEHYEDPAEGEGAVCVTAWNSKDKYLWSGCTGYEPGTKIGQVLRDARDNWKISKVEGF